MNHWMKVGIAGVTEGSGEYGEMLTARDVEIACVWDYVHSRADEFHRRFGGRVAANLDEIADEGLDGVILDVKPGDLAGFTVMLMAAGIPVLIADRKGIPPDEHELVSHAVREHVGLMMTAGDSGEETMEKFLLLCDTGYLPQ